MTNEQLAATPGPLIALVVGAACVVLSLSVAWRGDVSETAAGFWPAAGFTLVAMMLLPVRRWGWVVAGMIIPTVVAIVWFGAFIEPALWWYAGNCVQPAFAALVLNRCRSAAWITRGRLLVIFLVVAVVLGPMLGGAIGSIGTMRGYGSSWVAAWRDWVLGDGLGILVVIPLLTTYTTRRQVRRTLRETAGLGVAVMTATGLAFADVGANGAALLPYLILVGLIWAAMRFGTSAAAMAGFVLALGANVATAQGFGPFSARHGSVDAVTLQIFLAIALVTSFVVASMAADLADRDEVHRLLTDQATHDELTGLPNHILFAQRLEQAMLARQPDKRIGVMLLNLDDFKKINDRYGGPVGDETLIAVAQRLRRAVHPRNFVARLGGDEFVVLCKDIADSNELHLIAAAVAHGLARAIDVGGNPNQISACFGMAIVAGDDPITPTDLVQRAEIALQHAKRTTDLNISLFDDALEAHTRRRVEIVEELRSAIDRNELSVRYQPVVCLATGRVTEFEALARWDNRRFGPVSPGEFIPVAEDSGLITRLGDFVLDAACRQAVAWRSAGDVRQSLTRVSVNASARQLSDVAFPGRVRRILSAACLPADALTLEITETAVMDDLDASVRVLDELRRLGVKLSLDDFGTGFSSMTHLRRLPVDTLKIDCSFVAGLGSVAEDTAIVESIINLGHSFGLEVVAEGIETVCQLQHLVRLGCDTGQGFLWSAAIDARSAGAMIDETFDLPEVVPEIVAPV